MTDTTATPDARQIWVVDKDITDNTEAALTCAAVLHVLRDDIATVQIDAHTDTPQDDLPEEVRDAQNALTEIGKTQGGRDPGMGIQLDLSDPQHRELLDAFAPWSINVDLYGLGHERLGTFHDCGMWVHFRATRDQAEHVRQALTDVAPIISSAEFDARRREERRLKRAARRERLKERLRALSRVR